MEKKRKKKRRISYYFANVRVLGCNAGIFTLFVGIYPVPTTNRKLLEHFPRFNAIFTAYLYFHQTSKRNQKKKKNQNPLSVNSRDLSPL